jgi:hypothetical protein
MASFSVKRFLEEALIFIVLMVGLRYLSVFLMVFFIPFNLNPSLSSEVFSLPFLTLGEEIEPILINSISWAVTIIFLSLIFGYAILRSLHYHEDWINPKELANLHRQKLDFLAIRGDKAFYQLLSIDFTLSIATALAIGDVIAQKLHITLLGLFFATDLFFTIIFFVYLNRQAKLDGKKV